MPIHDYRKHEHIRLKLDELQQQKALERFQLVTRKGVYPYEYFDNFKKFEETALPKATDFYSSLTGETISNEDYVHALKVFETFEMSNLWDYHNLYLLTDVLLLSDILVAFRKMCLNYYNIDPFHCYTAPGFSWQASLRMTGQELELLDNSTIHQFFERGVRGGISMITQRHAEADSTHSLLYIDANNLYGWAMSQSLPTGNFSMTSGDYFHNLNVLSIADDAPRGCVLEVDLEYPVELHDAHNEYPLAPEHFQVIPEFLSNEQLSILENIERQRLVISNNNFIGPIKPIVPKCKKLIPNLMDKKNYIIHYRNLKLYLKLGMRVTKVHRVVCFDQKPWLKSYIDFNTEKRAQAKSDFEKAFFKLLNVSVFGKTMQNVRKERKLDIVDSEYKAKKLIAQTSFKNCTKFRDDLIAIERRKTALYFDKPIYAGFSILELSKEFMYGFHYQYVKQKYPGENSQLCFTDTDSFLYKVETDDMYADMVNDSEWFDFCDYPDEHACFRNMSKDEIKQIKLKNKKRIGKFKDEMCGERMLEFIGLRAKMYTYRSAAGETKKLKGIKSSVVKREIHFEHYKQCLVNRERMLSSMCRFNTHKHQVQTLKQTKVSLSCYDDKRYLLADSVTSLAYGHYKLRD